MVAFGLTCAVLILYLFATSISVVQGFQASSSGSYKGQRLYKSGDVIIGGLFPIHLKKNGTSCSGLRARALIWAETMINTIEEINRNRTFVSNLTLGYDIRDTCSNEQAGIETAADFVYHNNLLLPDSIFKFGNHCVPNDERDHRSTSPIVAVIGGEDTRVSMNVANVLQLEDVPQVSYGATSAELSDPQYTSFFRTVPPDRYQSKAMADLVLHNNWTCVAVIGVDDGYGRSGVKEFVNEAKTKDICIVAQDLFPVHDSEERIRELVSKFKSMKHVEIVILYSLPSQAVRVFEEAVKQNLIEKTWIASDGWSTSTFIQKPRFIPILKGTLGFEFHEIKFDSLERHLASSVSPATHNDTWWAEFWQEELNCSVNSSSTRYKPCTRNYSITSRFYQEKLKSVLNVYVRDAVYVVAHSLDLLSQCNSSNCVHQGSLVRPETVLSIIRNVTFQGLTGLLDHDKLRGQAQAGYDIVNLQVDKGDAYRLVKVGKWDAKIMSQNLELHDDRIQWKTHTIPKSTCGEVCKPGTYRSATIECLWECVPCDVDFISRSRGSTRCDKCPEAFIANPDHTKCIEVRVQTVRWNEDWGIILTSLTIFCVVAALATLVVSITYIKSPIFAETHPTLNILLIIELSGAYTLNFLQLSAFRGTNAYCRILPFWFYLVYSTALGTMLLKVYRIQFRVTLPQEQSTKHLGWKPYCITTLASLVPVFVGLLWVVIDPPTAQKNVISRLVVYEDCQSSQKLTGLVLRLFCVTYTSVFVLFILVAAYRTKSLPHNQKFHEAKHIAFAATIVAISFATFYPGWFFIEGPVVTVFSCSTNITAATGILVCLFVPKFNILLRHPTWNNRTCIRPSPLRPSPTQASPPDNTSVVVNAQNVNVYSMPRGQREVRFSMASDAQNSRLGDASKVGD